MTITIHSSTPAATWRAAGEPDPHGDRYDCERAALCMGSLTDDELANGAFMNYDQPLNVPGILAGTHSSPIAWMTAVKDRIRWLSRALVQATTAMPVADVCAAAERRKGRAEALQLLMGLDPEGGIDDYIGWSSPVGPEDEGSAHWDGDKLRELLDVDTDLADMLDKAEGEYYHQIGLREEAERISAAAHQAHEDLRDAVGQAISDEIASGAEQPDWCDSREVDRLANAAMLVLLMNASTHPPAESITLAELWEAAGANLDVKPDKALLLAALRSPAPAAPSSAPELPRMTFDQARNYLIKFMEQHFSDKTFHRYILNDRVENALAIDFAWEMATTLHRLDAQVAIALVGAGPVPPVAPEQASVRNATLAEIAALADERASTRKDTYGGHALHALAETIRAKMSEETATVPAQPETEAAAPARPASPETWGQLNVS